MRAYRIAVTAASVAALAIALAPSDAPAHPGAEPCTAWDVTYSLSGNLQLSETPMGAGDGVYAVGPGKMVLRHDTRTDRVALLSFELPEQFGIESRKAFWTTHVDTNATALAAPTATAGACGHVAEGAIQGRRLVWSSKVIGFHTDGTLACRGSMCGQFGVPPPGSSPLHIGPGDVQLQPFEFGPDGKTFTMASTYVSKTDMPKQTAHLAISGREVRRVCAPVTSCR
jgi:hypothetical protein